MTDELKHLISNGQKFFESTAIFFYGKVLSLFPKTAVTKIFRNAKRLRVRKKSDFNCNGLQWSVFVLVVRNFIFNAQSALTQLILLSWFNSLIFFFFKQGNITSSLDGS